jgi:hypothetical protein
MCGDADICHHPAEKDLYIVVVVAAGAPVAHKKQVVPMEGRVDLPLIPSAVFRNGIADWENPILSVFWIYNMQRLFLKVNIVHGQRKRLGNPYPGSIQHPEKYRIEDM